MPPGCDSKVQMEHVERLRIRGPRKKHVAALSVSRPKSSLGNCRGFGGIWEGFLGGIDVRGGKGGRKRGVESLDQEHSCVPKKRVHHFEVQNLGGRV